MGCTWSRIASLTESRANALCAAHEVQPAPLLRGRALLDQMLRKELVDLLRICFSNLSPLASVQLCVTAEALVLKATWTSDTLATGVTSNKEPRSFPPGSSESTVVNDPAKAGPILGRVDLASKETPISSCREDSQSRRGCSSAGIHSRGRP